MKIILSLSCWYSFGSSYEYYQMCNQVPGLQSFLHILSECHTDQINYQQQKGLKGHQVKISISFNLLPGYDNIVILIHTQSSLKLVERLGVLDG